MNDADSVAELPLSGVRVLEIASVLAVPFAGHVLGLLGAEVLKVEPPHGDPFRSWGSPDGNGGVFGYINAGKKSITADLRDPADVARLQRLLHDCDVVLTSGRPGMLARRGLGPQDCLTVNPELTVVSLTGFGDRGPLVDRPAYDSVVQSMTGLLRAYGVQGDVVSQSLPPLADLVAGLVTSQAVLAGLVRVARGRGGCVVETSLFEAVSSIMGPSYIRGDGLVTARPLQSLIFQFRCADGGLLTVHLSTSERFWRNLCAVLDPALADDARFASYGARIAHYDELQRRLADEFARRPACVWDQLLAAADVPAACILTVAEAVEGAQLAALGMLASEAEARSWIGAPWRIDGRRPPVDSHVPGIGEHNHLLPT